MKYKVHPVAELFPLIPKGSRPYNDLEENISLFGQMEPIVLDGELLLDGRNRLAICEGLGIEPKVAQWKSLGITVPIHEWIFSKNFARRNLTEDQRLAVHVEYNRWTIAQECAAAKQAPLKKGAQVLDIPVPTKSYARAEESNSDRNARDTIGKLSAAAGATRYKTQEVVAIAKAAEAGDKDAKEDWDALLKGVKTVKEIKKARKPKAAPKPKLLFERMDDALTYLRKKFDGGELKQFSAWLTKQL